jgi:hypothetical protein
LRDSRTKEASENSSAALFVIVVVTRELELGLSLDVEREVAHVVEQRRDDHHFARSSVVCQRSTLESVVGLRDRFTVGLVAEGFVKIEQFVDGPRIAHAFIVGQRGDALVSESDRRTVDDVTGASRWVGLTYP